MNKPDEITAEALRKKTYKPDKEQLNITKGNEHPEEWQKPDDRLLTDEEIIIAVCGDCPLEGRFSNEDCHACQRQFKGIAKAQRDLTASIKEAECGQGIREIEDLFRAFVSHLPRIEGDYRLSLQDAEWFLEALKSKHLGEASDAIPPTER